eukprot:m.463785 g.463785  ORF g.463785 m.463785 type:complete len:88 (+) comp23167_c0_seq1:77-340(+)
MGHKTKPPAADDEEADPWVQRIEATGCAAQHYALQDCYSETGDWRLCQAAMKSFRLCMKQSSTANRTAVEITGKEQGGASTKKSLAE